MSQDIYIRKGQETLFMAAQVYHWGEGGEYDDVRVYQSLKKAKQYNPVSRIWEVTLDWKLVDDGE